MEEQREALQVLNRKHQVETAGLQSQNSLGQGIGTTSVSIPQEGQVLRLLHKARDL